MINPKAERKCFYCFKTGVAACKMLKQKQLAVPPNKQKGVGLIKTAHPNGHFPFDESEDCFKPFTFKAFVSLTGNACDERPVNVLRDTGGSQSFILSNVLPLSDRSVCDSSAIVRDIGMECVLAPMHWVHVRSSLATGFFSVAVRACLPEEGIDFIMGNDLAGGKVYPTPEVVSMPIPDFELNNATKESPHAFGVSVLTRAQARKQDGQTQYLQLSFLKTSCLMCV